MTPCKREGCGQPARIKGWCRKDYTWYWHQIHPRKNAEYRAAWYASHIERTSVEAHYAFICRRTRLTYAGLPFCDEWNPEKGGSFKAGEKWIIANLGRRPGPRYELHIVDRRLGFVPGNLMWVPQSRHRQEELINRLLRENQQLRLENAQLKAAQ